MDRSEPICFGQPSAKTGQTLLAVYDLSAAPVSYDFAIFLALAELHRGRLGLDGTHVLFVPGPGDGFWANEALDLQQRRWRMRNLLIPLCWLWSGCQACTVLGSREEAERWLRRHAGAVFPVGYTLARPIADIYHWAHATAEYACGARLPSWEAPPQARTFVRQWLQARADGRRVVVLTLREAGYYAEINSDIDAWAAFARSLDPVAYVPVVLRDTEAAFGPVPPALGGLDIFPEASLSVELRAALYEQAFVGLSVGTGPMMLQWLNPLCRFIIFRLLIPQNFRSRPTPLRSMGIDVGGQLATGMPFQRLAWKDDTFETIKEEFDRMVGEIDAGEGRAPSEPPLRIARRLRLTGREAAAERIYAYVEKAPADAITRAGAKAGRALIERGRRRRSGLRGKLADRFFAPRLDGPPELTSPLLDPDPLLDLVEWLLSRDRVEGAERICCLIVERWPDNAEAQGIAGEIELRGGRTDEALVHLRRSVALDPWSATMRYRCGVALLLQGRDQEAAAEFRAAVLNDPSHEAAQLRLRTLAPTLPLPAGFAYEDALSRRPSAVGGTVGELDFPIAPATERKGYDIVYFRGLFHAVPDTGERVAVDWRNGRACRLAARWTPISHRLGVDPARRSIAARLTTALLYRRRRADDALTAASLAALDRCIAHKIMPL